MLALAGTTAAHAAAGTQVDQLMRKLEDQRKSLQKQEKALESQMQEMLQQQKELKAQREQFEKLEKEVYAAAGKEPPPPARETQQATAAPVTPVQTGSVPEEVGTERKPEEKERPPEVTLISDETGVLLKKGRLIVEPSFEYSRSSALRVAIEGFTIIPALNIGSFEITQVDRDTLTAALGLRYGLTKRLEVDMKVPYMHRADNTLSRPLGVGAGGDTLQEITGDGIGDIEFGAHYQLNQGKNGWPFFIANMRYKAATGTDPFEVPKDPNTGLQLELPTGSGFSAIQPSVTAIYPTDPAVFFANMGYLYNMSKNVGGGLGEIDPGDAVSASFGMGFSINEQSSFSIGYSHTTVFKTLRGNQAVPNSEVLQVGSLDLGYAYRLNDWTNLNLNIGAGLTTDAPDVRVVFRVPMAFDLLK